MRARAKANKVCNNEELRAWVSEASEGVSPLSNGSPVCKYLWEYSENVRPERGLIWFIFSSDVGVCVCVLVCVHWGLSLARCQSTTDFDTDGVCGSPLFPPRSTSARIQHHFEFVELGCGMSMCSNYQGEVPVVTGITGWYQVPGSIREQCQIAR